MVFALTSFTDESSLRRFTFELAGSGPPRTSVVVVADMALVGNMRFRSRNCAALRSPTPKLDSGRRRYGSALGKGDDRACQSPKRGEGSGGTEATHVSGGEARCLR